VPKCRFHRWSGISLTRCSIARQAPPASCRRTRCSLIHLADTKERERELHLLANNVSADECSTAIVLQRVLPPVSREFNDSSRMMASIKRNDRLFRRSTSFNCTASGSAGNLAVCLHPSSIIAAVLSRNTKNIETVWRWNPSESVFEAGVRRLGKGETFSS